MAEELALSAETWWLWDRRWIVETLTYSPGGGPGTKRGCHPGPKIGYELSDSVLVGP